jgi:hypothetical protein
MTRESTPWLMLLVQSLVVGACGGAATPGASSTPSNDEKRGAEASDSGPAATDDAENTDAAPQRVTCDDGTCTPCGDAHCPIGWYCDESAAGGPACGWLPECAQKPGCACVKRALPSCACEEKAGAAHLSCK